MYLGTWENDANYSEFRTMGAKKYAYIKKGDDSNALHITVAGLSKDKGAQFLVKEAKRKGKQPIELFKRGTVVPKGSSGRTIHYYNDLKEPITITINNTKIVTGSNVAIINGEYTFGISDDYLEYICSIDPLAFDDEEEIDYDEADYYTD